MEQSRERERLLRLAMILALITIGYNLVEGVVSVFFGLEDETISLFGFGLDSFVEVISGAGIFHMILRIRKAPTESPDRFERLALRITGGAFYLLFLSIAATSAVNLLQGHQPETTFWGIVIASISILTMWLLILFKMKVGRALDSQAIIADAHCTRACLSLSVVLLAASLLYELTGVGGFDALGGIAIALLSLREGREAFQKARGLPCCSSCQCP
ncbi:MAG: cation transporter [Desulfovibrionales bacterium]